MTWLAAERTEMAADRILDAAAAVFRRKGVAATGMGDIAKAAGCSRATLYRYFDSRQALHVAFVHREARRIGRVVAAEVAAATDPHDRVATAVLAALREVRSDPTLAAWFTHGDAGIAAELAQSSAVIASLGAAFLGDPADDDVRAAAAWLVRVIVSLLTIPGSGPDDERALVERFVVPGIYSIIS